MGDLMTLNDPNFVLLSLDMFQIALGQTATIFLSEAIELTVVQFIVVASNHVSSIKIDINKSILKSFRMKK